MLNGTIKYDHYKNPHENVRILNQLWFVILSIFLELKNTYN